MYITAAIVPIVVVFARKSMPESPYWLMKYYTYRGQSYTGFLQWHRRTVAAVCAKNGRGYLYIDKSKECMDIAFDRVKPVVLGEKR